MSAHVLVRPAAEADSLEAFDWYESRRPGLGREFLHEVRDTRRELRRIPSCFPLFITPCGGRQFDVFRAGFFTENCAIMWSYWACFMRDAIRVHGSVENNRDACRSATEHNAPHLTHARFRP